jgi:chromosome partitioning protein
MPLPPKPRILVVANQKGGVGKTTTAINLGTALAAVGEPTLVIDIDPQGNASTGLGIHRQDRGLTTYEVLTGQARLAEAIVPTRIPGLSLVPATVDLSGAELELIDFPRRNFILKDALEEYSVHGASARAGATTNNEASARAGATGKEASAQIEFSYVLIDCPPSLTLLTLNAMAAADAVLVPLQCEFFALEGLSQLMKTIDLVKDKLNPGLEMQGIVLTMFDKRNKLSDQVAADVRQTLGEKVYATVIPRNVRISEAPSHGVPALVYDLRCPGSQAYIKLAGELIQRERIRAAA